MTVTVGPIGSAPTPTVATIGDKRIDLTTGTVWRNGDGAHWSADAHANDDVTAALLAEPTSQSRAAFGAHVGVTGAGCVAWRSTAQSIPNGTDTVILFDSEAYDTGGFHEPVTNPSRITVPTGLAGTYLAAAHIRFVANATGIRSAWIRKNGTTFIANTPIAAAATATGVVTLNTVQLAAGDYLELGCWHNAGVALNTDVSGTNLWTYLSLARVGDR